MPDLNLAARLARIARQSTLDLTHHGRKSGKPYHVTLWFTVEDETMYLATMNKNRQWCRNVRVRPQVSLRIGRQTFAGEVAVITDSIEGARVAELVKKKYWYALPYFWIMRLMGRPAIGAAFRVALEPPDMVA
jgi:deazaflavin-dependent oxidoreductase (nitroreductase family)